jgi:Tol biopolymer transport system component
MSGPANARFAALELSSSGDAVQSTFGGRRRISFDHRLPSVDISSRLYEFVRQNRGCGWPLAPRSRRGEREAKVKKLFLAGLLALLFALPAGATTGGSNGLLAYQAQVGKHIQLFTIKPDGSGTRQITRLPDSDATAAAWSPNGQRIAFARDYAAGTSQEHLDIVVINADGSGSHAFGLHGLNGEPSWSPDGRHLVWGTSRGLSIANSDGSKLRQIRLAGFEGSPVFSPDGKRIAFRRNEQRGESISIVNTDGSGLRRVRTFAGGLGDKIDWSADGSRIAYDSPSFGPPKSSNIFTMRIDGSGARQLTHAAGGKVNYGIDSWSPDGQKIAFVSNVSGSYAIYTMNVNGTGSTRLTHGPEAHLAAWGTHPLTP